MAGYERKTALAPAGVLEKAEEWLPEYIGLQRSKQGSHGPFTEVTARTDRLRTSRMDYEIQRFLNCLPYEYGDAGGPGSGDPA